MNMESKMLFIIISVTCVIVPALSRYTGDSCNDQNSSGTCTPLSQCRPMLDEINTAGSPMPMHIREKLYEIGCGFSSTEPMVCCVLDQDTESPISNKPVTIDIDILANFRNSTGGQTDNSNSISPSKEEVSSPEDVSSHPNLWMLPKKCGTMYSDRIWGGNRTLLSEMPWMVILSYDEDGVNKMGCGGTLINDRYVLTAAHCVNIDTKLRLTGVILGEYDLRKDPDCQIRLGNTVCAPPVVNATIEEVISHPGYRRTTLFDDIALIRLAQPANFSLSSMAPICLPITRQLQEDELDELLGEVTGWGITEDNRPSPVLLRVALPILTNEQCQAAYLKTNGIRIYQRQLCAGWVKNKDSCGGDSGGPLMYPGITGSGGLRYVQRGLVSFGPRRCGIGGFPSVYTRISYYMKWILDNIRS